MPEVVSIADKSIKRERFSTRNGGDFWRMQLIDHPRDRVDAPEAFVIEGDPGRQLRTHFHDVDQFQIITSGSGTLGRHTLVARGVHFAGAYTPYGPILSGQEGLGYLTLRARRDPLIAQYLPECRDKLAGIPGRSPWQHTTLPDFSAPSPGGDPDALMPIHGLSEVHGLAAHSLCLQPGARLRAPNPSSGGCQFVVVLKGALVYRGVLRPALTVVFVARNEPAFEVQAGPRGLEALILGFPGRQSRSATVAATGAEGNLKLWQCALCAFIYDEVAGLPDDGIAPGTRWQDVPENWACPDCSATRRDFQMVEI